MLLEIEDLCWTTIKVIKCFTGEHQVQGKDRTRVAIEALLANGLPNVVAQFRA